MISAWNIYSSWLSQSLIRKSPPPMICIWQISGRCLPSSQTVRHPVNNGFCHISHKTLRYMTEARLDAILNEAVQVISSIHNLFFSLYDGNMIFIYILSYQFYIKKLPLLPLITETFSHRAQDLLVYIKRALIQRGR